MTQMLHFAPQEYPGGRITLMLGKHQVGAVFVPGDATPRVNPWTWGFWFGSTGSNSWTSGNAKSELAAKNALLAKAEEWLRDAGVV